MNSGRVAASVYLLLALGSVCPAIGQSVPAGGVIAVEHAVPFGTVRGNLLLLGDYLVFVDEQQPSASFVVPRNAMETLTADGSAITVQTTSAVRNRSGETRRLSFRVASGADPAVVTSWYGGGSATGSSNPSARSTPSSSATYQARHDHRIGDCRGQLVVGSDQLSYESVTDVGHSRRWPYRAIKEIKLSNPYELDIKPFAGGTYKIRFDGTGMDPAAYKVVVDRVTAARAGA